MGAEPAAVPLSWACRAGRCPASAPRPGPGLRGAPPPPAPRGRRPCSVRPVEAPVRVTPSTPSKRDVKGSFYPAQLLLSRCCNNQAETPEMFEGTIPEPRGRCVPGPGVRRPLVEPGLPLLPPARAESLTLGGVFRGGGWGAAPSLGLGPSGVVQHLPCVPRPQGLRRWTVVLPRPPEATAEPESARRGAGQRGRPVHAEPAVRGVAAVGGRGRCRLPPRQPRNSQAIEHTFRIVRKDKREPAREWKKWGRRA